MTIYRKQWKIFFCVLTFIILIAHNLASSIIKTDGETWTVSFNISPSSCVPVDTCYTDSSSRIGETADGHFHLKHYKDYQKTNCANMLSEKAGMP